MSYYYVFLNECADFDEETVFLRPGIENIGLVFDWWPPDDIFESSSEVFCTERLKSMLETDFQKFTGIERFELIQRTGTGANWNWRHPDALPGKYWRIHINGQAIIDDLGYYYSSVKRLVVSERLMKFLIHNHATEILGAKIEGDIKSFFQDYEMNFINNKNFLPPKLFNLDSLL